jgi:hypothetical protein
LKNRVELASTNSNLIVIHIQPPSVGSWMTVEAQKTISPQFTKSKNFNKLRIVEGNNLILLETTLILFKTITKIYYKQLFCFSVHITPKYFNYLYLFIYHFIAQEMINIAMQHSTAI